MRWVLLILGVLLFLAGTVWALQGVGILPGSFMSGQGFWLGAGLVTLLIGVGLFVAGMRMGAARPRI